LPYIAHGSLYCRALGETSRAYRTRSGAGQRSSLVIFPLLFALMCGLVVARAAAELTPSGAAASREREAFVARHPYSRFVTTWP